MRLNAQETADFVTFTEKILNGKIRFLYRVVNYNSCTIFDSNKWPRSSSLQEIHCNDQVVFENKNY